MSTFLRSLRSVAAVLAGYVVIVLGTILTLEVWLGGIGWAKSSRNELVLATVGTLVSGIAGGLVAAWLAGRRPFQHAVAVLIPIAFDTANILWTGISPDPVWFDLGGSMTLVAGALIGGYLLKTKRPPPEQLSRPANS